MTETRQCQNCKIQFLIEPEDFDFYKKISVPPPTFCSECRAVRRMIFRNLRTLYLRDAVGAKDKIISNYSPEAPFPVYEYEYWVSDEWDPMEYGREYDFSRPFFEQMRELMNSVPWLHGWNLFSVRSDYCFNVSHLRDCYFLFNSGFSENSAYATELLNSNRVIDATKTVGSEMSYELLDCEKCYRSFFSVDCVECSDVYFCRRLINCRNCFGCVNLRHKQYCIFNKQHTKEEYENYMKNLNPGSHENLNILKSDTSNHFAGYPVRFMHGTHNTAVTGDYIDHSKNVRKSFLCRDLENCAYCQLILFMPTKDSFDISVAAGELCYELEEAGGYKVQFSYRALPKNLSTRQINLSNLKYIVNCMNSSNLFGCVGIRNKQYCILNKQYTKEEYEMLVPRIIEQMNTVPYIDARGRVYKYGEFFPPELSPFAYNETIAQDYFPLTKEQALAQGYRWKDPEERHYEVTVKAENLPDHIKDVEDSILKETIGCAHEGKCNEQCTTAFKIIEPELQFYRKMNLPLPRLCPNCRHYQRLKQRNPLKLWHRQCTCDYQVYKNTVKHDHHPEGRCPNEFQTSYAPERPEIVYCEQCYQQEVI